MNWYKQSSLQSFFQDNQISSDVQSFILSLPNQEKAKYISVLKKNPQATLDQIKQVGQVTKKTVDPYYQYEKELAARLPAKARRWGLVELKKARKSNLSIPETVIRHENIGHTTYPNLETYFRVRNNMEVISRTNSLADFLRANPQYDIDSHSFDKVYADINEWHEVMSGKGSGRFYEPLNEKRLVYGPKWKNPSYAGWTMQEVVSENDLLVEGNLLHHCVGDYCRNVEEGESRIFSLRDPSNNPKVTIETNWDLSVFRQIFGYGNQEPDDEHKPMIKEWIENSLNNPVNASSYNDDFQYNIKEIKDIMSKMILGLEGKPERNEYGLLDARYTIKPTVDDYKNLVKEVLLAYEYEDWHLDVFENHYEEGGDLLEEADKLKSLVPKVFEVAYVGGIWHLNSLALYLDRVEPTEFEHVDGASFFKFYEFFKDYYDKQVKAGKVPPWEKLFNPTNLKSLSKKYNLKIK